jgi:hypothetical protein
MSNKHQLIPNTYCICESKKQCKELFEWAKDNEIDVYDNCQSNDIILYVDVDMEIGSCCEEHEVKGYTLITLPEFLLRLQGKWQPNEVSDYQSLYEELLVKHEKLTQGVKDAKTEMEKHSAPYKKSFDESWAGGKYQGLQKASKILTEKTGI